MIRSMLTALTGITLMAVVVMAGENAFTPKVGERFWIVVDETSPEHPKNAAAANQTAQNSLSFDRGVILLHRIRQMRSPTAESGSLVDNFAIPVTIIQTHADGTIEFEAAGMLANSEVYAIHLHGTVNSSKLTGPQPIVSTGVLENKNARLVTLEEGASPVNPNVPVQQGATSTATGETTPKKSWKEKMFGWMKRS